MDPSQPAAQPQPATPSPGPAPLNRFNISQEFKLGRESFAVTDGQNLVCVAKLKILSIKEHIDVYHDEAATQLVFTIEQDKAVAISKSYSVVSAAGQRMGGFKLEAMQSLMKEHWDILDAAGNLIGAIDQDSQTAMAGRVGGMMAGMAGGGVLGMAANLVPQRFVASLGGQPVCVYQEEINLGVYFKMDIDFSADTGGLFDRTLGIAAAILLSSKHMQTK